MAVAMEEVLLASAMDALDIGHYWSDSNYHVREKNEEIDGEYPIILLFYATLLDDMMNRNLVTQQAVQMAICHLQSNYRSTKNGITPEDLDYNNLNNCFGYLHKYAACHTAMVRTALKRVFHVSPPVAIKRLLCLKDSVDVVSLGGGPGNDLHGFCSALYGKHYGFLNINMTIIDQMRGWEQVFNRTEKMLRNSDFGEASALFKEVDIKTSFVVGNLTDIRSWSPDLVNKLETADIFLLVKVLSVIPDREKAALLQAVVMKMKPGAVLLFIDCPFPSQQFSTVGHLLDCVYEREKEKFYYCYQVFRFNYSNITMSNAVVRIYVKKFIAAQV